MPQPLTLVSLRQSSAKLCQHQYSNCPAFATTFVILWLLQAYRWEDNVAVVDWLSSQLAEDRWQQSFLCENIRCVQRDHIMQRMRSYVADVLCVSIARLSACSAMFYQFCPQLAAQHCGQNAGLCRRTFPILRQTASWTGDHFVVKPSAIGQPTWPTQPSIPQGSVIEQ